MARGPEALNGKLEVILGDLYEYRDRLAGDEGTRDGYLRLDTAIQNIEAAQYALTDFATDTGVHFV